MSTPLTRALYIRLPSVALLALTTSGCAIEPGVDLKHISYALDSVERVLAVPDDDGTPVIASGGHARLWIRGVRFERFRPFEEWEGRVRAVPHRPVTADDCWDMSKAAASPWTAAHRGSIEGFSEVDAVLSSSGSAGFAGPDAVMLQLETRDRRAGQPPEMVEIEVAVLPEETAEAWSIWATSRNVFNSGTRNRRCRG